MKIIKRNGEEVNFDINKIKNAVKKASDATVEESMSDSEIQDLAEYLEFVIQKMDYSPNVDEIQQLVERQIMAAGRFKIAINYIEYRYRHDLIRKANTTDDAVLSLIDCNNEEIKQENSNKNPTVNSVQRDYMAGEVSKDITKRLLLPPEIEEAHEQGIIHFHDSDYFIQHMHNCDLVNLEDMLQNGTVISDTLIEKPHSFSTACNVATQIIAQVASNQYGSQSISLAHLAPFIEVSRQQIRDAIKKEQKEVHSNLSDTDIQKLVDMRLKKEITKGVQTIQYQVVTLQTTNGQAPFVTVFMYLNEAKNEQEKKDLAMLIEEVLKQRITGVKNEKGIWITPAFPKLVYVLEEDNIEENSPYYYLTELAAKCTAKRMVPDYVSEKVMLELKGDVYPPMGCRSFLTPDRFTKKTHNIPHAKNYVEGEHKYYGRFNQGVVTINLVDVALSSKGNKDEFWKIFDERLELCRKALMLRHERLKGTKSSTAPILWQYGALARLGKDEVIDKLLYNGYSTISLGYAGLYECTKYMTGKSHTDDNGGKQFALSVMQHMNDMCDKWKAETNIDFSLYGTPMESTTYKFAKCLQRRFGKITDVTDHNYITNSYHVNVREQIDAFTKLKFESEFQKLSPGGAISYVEVPNMQDNIPAVLQVIKFIYNNIMYAELNTKSDYCQVCGYDGEIQIVENKDGKLIWQCPKCGNTNQDKMNVARRTCGKRTDIATLKNNRNSGEVHSYNKIDYPEPSPNKNKQCDVCGRHLLHAIGYYGQHLCNKHYNQIKKYGKPLDTSPRTIYDLNEITVIGDVAYIDLYDKSYNVIAQAIIDAEDVNKVRFTKWRLKAGGKYVVNWSKYSGSTIFLHRRILNTNEFVDHMNGNPLDNRKSNLRIVTKSQNQMNVNYKGISLTNNGKYYAYIKLNQKMMNLGVYIDECDALYARWFAETILFGEYRFPKQEPELPEKRKAEIREYVSIRIQKSNKNIAA